MVFMFIMYREEKKLHCACEIANREDPYAVAVDILSKFRINKYYSNPWSMLHLN